MKAYELMTNEILSALGSDVVPWRRPNHIDAIADLENNPLWQALDCLGAHLFKLIKFAK